jgi:hypothetical protein
LHRKGIFLDVLEMVCGMDGGQNQTDTEARQLYLMANGRKKTGVTDFSLAVFFEVNKTFGFKVILVQTTT